MTPLLDHCPPTLPRAAYLDAAWYAREMATLWSHNWVNMGRLDDLPPGQMRPETVANAPILLARLPDGSIKAYHNTCRHRGAELCARQTDINKLITCPYHAWSYAAETGRLISTAHATPTDDFIKQDNALHPVPHLIWNGFIFLNLSPQGPLHPDLGLDALNNWPMDTLKTGHTHSRLLNCNWKLFWENYNECLHCPGIHPELCDMVPIYGKGVMSPQETTDWPAQPNLKPGAQSWTTTGDPCGPLFPNLTPKQHDDAYTFVTLYPSTYIVAHVDYVRCVRLQPIGPEQTLLTAEWLFTDETLTQPGFNAQNTAAFATTVLQQDGDAVEMNQRGIRSPAYRQGTLMPQEFDIHHFHTWVLQQMEPAHE